MAEQDYYKAWVEAYTGKPPEKTTAKPEETQAASSDLSSGWMKALGDWQPQPQEESWLSKAIQAPSNYLKKILTDVPDNPLTSIDPKQMWENASSAVRGFMGKAGMETPEMFAERAQPSIMQGVAAGSTPGNIIMEKQPSLLKKVGQNIVETAKFGPETVAKFLNDPLGTMQNNPMDVFLLIEGFAGPKIRLKAKSAIAKMKVGTFTDADMAGIMKEVSSLGPKDWKIPDISEGMKKIMMGENLLPPAGISAGQKLLPQAPGFVGTPGGELIPSAKFSEMPNYSAGPQEINIPPAGRQVPGLMAQFVDEQGKPVTMADVMARKQGKVGQAAEDVLVSQAGRQEPNVQPTGQVPSTPAAADVFMAAVKKAPMVRGLQEAMRAEERAVRVPAAIEAGKAIAGEAGWKAQKAALSGEYARAQFDAIRKELGPTPEAQQSVVNDIFKQVQDSYAISETQKWSAKSAIEDIIDHGKVPQEKQLVYLNKIFGDEFVRTLLDKKDLFAKWKEMGLEIANVPRAIMASTDLSFGLRQALMMATSHPIIFWKDWLQQFNKGGKKAFAAVNEEIVSRPTYRLADKANLALTDVGEIIAKREEQYQSPLAEKIPLLGPVVGWSNRVYTAFANKLRMDVFDYYVKRAGDLGRDVWSDTFQDWAHKKGISTAGMDEAGVLDLRKQFNSDQKLIHDIAKIVNNGTGRGTFGPHMENFATVMNSLMFSPRLFASRFNTLLNPHYYKTLDPFARKAQLKMTLSMVGTGVTTLALLKKAGLEVGTNPTSADFGKIKLGNTRIDIWGGYQQYAVLASRMLMGETTSSSTGKTSDFNKGFGSPNRMTMLGNFFQGKLSPLPAFAVSLLQGSNVMGEKFDIKKGLDQPLSSGEWMKNPVASWFIPMVINDLADIAKDDPSLIPAAALGVFGVGLQTYQPTPKKKKIY